MFRFTMTIGDWSGDGHGASQPFLVDSNYPIERVREAHFASARRTGIDVEALCADYQEDQLPLTNQNRLQELGYQFSHLANDFDRVTPDEMIRIWVFLLNYTDPPLGLTICEDSYPELHFSGLDSQGRHIGSVGYGLF